MNETKIAKPKYDKTMNARVDIYCVTDNSYLNNETISSILLASAKKEKLNQFQITKTRSKEKNERAGLFPENACEMICQLGKRLKVEN